MTAERDSEARWAKDYLARAEQAERELSAAQAVIDAARMGLSAVRTLIGSSRGVAGLHRNGDEEPWDELLAGGRFETWLFNFSAAQGALLDYDAAKGGR